MKVHNSEFDAFLEEFTSNTYIMVITSAVDVCKCHDMEATDSNTLDPAATQLNIENAKPHFEKLLGKH